MIRLGKMIEELGAKNTEGDDDENLEELHPYIHPSVPISRLPIKEAGLPLDTLAAHGCSMMC